MARQKEPLTGSDRYGLIIPTSWLEGESIASVDWSCAELDITEPLIEQNKISARFELADGTGFGTYKVLATINTTATPPREKVIQMQIQASASQQ